MNVLLEHCREDPQGNCVHRGDIPGKKLEGLAIAAAIKEPPDGRDCVVSLLAHLNDSIEIISK